ncbi:MAG TPA: futalosine hydrolase [Flavisolibacter sp.]|nr:futalosine hydrolase [Flavisolibacter sp.]
MKILLCAATEMEIAPTLQQLSGIEKHSIELVITGVGLMTSTYALAKGISIHQPQLVIQAGIAGTLEAEQVLGDVVAVQAETVGDLGVLEKTGFHSLFDLNLLSVDLSPWKAGQLVNEHDVLKNIGLPLVNGVTVNEISTDEATISYYREHLNAQVETMEGAALHYVTLMERIPFLQIRSLSNYIGERDKSKWEMKKAIANLNKELQNLLNKDFRL